MNVPEGEGVSRAPRRVHLESEARQGDWKAQAELDAIPRCPPRGEYLMAYFWQLSPRRGQTGMGPMRISRAEIRQWQEDEYVELERWERRTILAIDDEWFRCEMEALASSTPPPK